MCLTLYEIILYTNTTLEAMMKTMNLLGTEVKISTIIKYTVSYVAFIIVLLLLDRIPNSFLYHKISWYGVIIGTGFLIGLLVAVLQCHYRNIEPEFMYTLLLYVFPFAIVGARIYYVLFELERFTSFYSVIAVWEGGLAIYGGVIGGAIALILACIIHKKSIIDTLDIVIPSLLIGQVIGRWGNFVNQEAYGLYISNPSFQFFPFGVYIEHCTQLAEGCVCGGSGWHLATFFYESLWNLVGFIIAIMLLKTFRFQGLLVAFYCIYYGIGRFWIEGLRMDSLYWGIFRVSQLLSLLLVLIGVGLMLVIIIKNRRKNEKNNLVSHD